ncbi:MAG: lipopolysaccharide/colanic/teichoic acid biosynthesis glycosyltransferase [Candidatus Azotimanducaceae bacterium]|jgi:lipopolysaccharide/colanic/teichoic acid biosynthesis glycosyltransferase
MGERTRELLILILGDVFFIVVSLYLTLFVRYFEIPDEALLEAHFGPFLILSGVWLFVFYIAGLYDKHTVFLKNLLFSRILNTQAVNGLIASLLFLIIPFGIAPKTNLVIYLIISVLLISWWRLKLFNRFSPKNRHKALLIADGDEAIELVDEINNNDRYNYAFVRIIDEKAAMHTPDFEAKLLALINQENIKIIVANPTGEHIERVLPSIFDLAFLKFEFIFLDFYKVYEDTFDRVPLSALRYDWFITHVSQSKSLVYDFFKRAFDIFGSIVLSGLFLILLPIIYIAMRIEGNKNIFMVQKRIGQFNTPVDVIKLQTMTENDASSSTWTIEDHDKGNAITKVGAIVRKLSLDEVPQVWNILKGEMSLIGPRNDIVGLGARLAEQIPYYNIRNFVKPGVSGWAQTHQHYMGDNISPQSLEESRLRLAYDLYYVKNRSFMLDMSILFRTLKTLLARFDVTIKLPK